MLKRYVFQWAPPTNQAPIEVIAHNAGTAWFKACDAVACLPDDLILVFEEPINQEENHD